MVRDSCPDLTEQLRGGTHHHRRPAALALHYSPKAGNTHGFVVDAFHWLQGMLYQAKRVPAPRGCVVNPHQGRFVHLAACVAQVFQPAAELP